MPATTSQATTTPAETTTATTTSTTTTIATTVTTLPPTTTTTALPIMENASAYLDLHEEVRDETTSTSSNIAEISSTYHGVTAWSSSTPIPQTSTEQETLERFNISSYDDHVTMKSTPVTLPASTISFLSLNRTSPVVRSASIVSKPPDFTDWVSSGSPLSTNSTSLKLQNIATEVSSTPTIMNSSLLVGKSTTRIFFSSSSPAANAQTQAQPVSVQKITPTQLKDSTTSQSPSSSVISVLPTTSDVASLQPILTQTNFHPATTSQSTRVPLFFTQDILVHIDPSDEVSVTGIN